MSWYLKNKEEILHDLNTRETGLSLDESEERLAKYGPNALEGEEGVSPLTIMLNQLKSPLIYILLIAGVVTLLLGEYIDSGVIFFVILLNGVVGFVQEYRAEQSVRSLQKMVSPKAVVVRGGREKEIESEKLVPGDVVRLIGGTMIPADIRLINSVELRIDESMLTGESIPAEKTPHDIDEADLSPGDQTNMAFMGSVAVNGRGTGVVVETGQSTILGSIASDIRDIGVIKAPIQEKIHRFAQAIGVIVLGAASLLFALGIIVGESVIDMFMTAVAAAVATIPEGLPIVVTIAMAVGVKRMANHRSVIRKLPAVETLGSTTIICTDKTGTLTVNEMTVVAAYDGTNEYSFEGSGYIPEGAILKDGSAVEPSAEPGLMELMRIGLLCNESRIVETDGKYFAEGDPTEAALIVSARKAGLDHEGERKTYHERAILPFESDRGYMATLNEMPDGVKMLVKGGHDRLMELCTSCSFSEGLDRQEIISKAEEMAGRGLRVLAIGYRDMPDDRDHLSDDDVGQGLVFAGLVGMIDPPRQEAAAAVEGCHKAGIRVIMITGDHAITANAIAGQLGIETSGREVITGRELKNMSDEELDREVREVSVFARIAPEDKQRIVDRLKAMGEIVAVTGDGVNDAPALKSAHIGVAMGKGGTDVAREAADMVLMDDNFSSIYKAVREGRIVFDNLRKVTFFLIPTGIAAVWSILATILMGLPIPYVPAQLLWINLVTNGLQDVALAFEPGEHGVEHRPPRPTKEGIINSLLIQRTVIVSLLIALGVVVDFVLSNPTEGNLDHARTMAMTTMVLFQFFQAVNSRSEYESIFRINPFSNKFLFVSMVLAILAQVAVIYTPALQWIFRTSPLSAGDWMLAVSMASSVIVVVEIDKWIRRRRMNA